MTEPLFGSRLAELFLASVLSGAVISTVLGFVFHRKAESIKHEFAQRMAVFESKRTWQEQSVAELLGPMYMQLDRTKRAFRRWERKNLFLEVKVIRDGNVAIRDLLLTRAQLIPPDLLEDAGKLIEHYDRWLEEFERVRESEQPDLETPFVFVGPKGYPFPVQAEASFRKAFAGLWRELYGAAETP
jgi:hypothetical protein